VVGLEHVAAHHDEGTALGGSERTDGAHHREARAGEPRLSLGVEVVPGHPELPVGGVDESHLGHRTGVV
jgi:hypothetical protein